MKRILAALGLVASTLSPSSPATANGTWGDATEVRLMVSSDGTGQPVEYLIELLSEGDARITEMDSSAPSDQWPVIVLVGGQVMLVQNMELEEGYEIDAMDGPVLMLQLTLSLLAKGLADGPTSLPTEGSVEVQKVEQEEPIEVSTTSAGGQFPAPWRLSGTATREEGDRIAYSLDLVYTSGTEKPTVEIDGHWKKTDPRPKLDPAMALTAWKSYEIGPIERTSASGTIYDFGAQPVELEAQTLRELRLEISEQ